jgi:hypothetical protein
VTWFGAHSFWGHLRHLLAAAIASEGVDSRHWMTPDDPEVLRARIAETLGGDPTAPTVVEGLGRDLYIDFVSDTGDDVTVSRAVAGLVFASYELPDPDRPGQFLTAPRGDILFFGGDTAYPVGTAKEILNRVIVPWNRVLAELAEDGDGDRDGRPRVLLGIPGNHDWYDGADGFARMFRCRPDDRRLPAPLIGVKSSQLAHSVEWLREFVQAGTVDKPDALVLAGYIPVQSASYFALRLAPGIDLIAVDRQLTAIDARQRTYLRRAYRAHPGSAALLVIPDPVHLFGDPSKTGTQMVDNLRIDATSRKTFVLSGDIHHYERSEQGEALHVIAGGGGAFLHPARIARGGLPPTVIWPNVAQSRALLRGVPWKLARGRSGWLPHFFLVLLYAPTILFSGGILTRWGGRVGAAVVETLVLGMIFALLGGLVGPRPGRKRVLPLAFVAAALFALLPIGISLLVSAVRPLIAHPGYRLAFSFGALALAAFVGTLGFGALLTLFTLFGYDHLHALTALDHPGFKHFVRLRVRADGSGIDGWCIGAADPLRRQVRPELVDQFVWRPFETLSLPPGKLSQS